MPKKSKKELSQEQTAKISAILNNYTTWEQDFGFLSLIITREVNLHKLFILETYSMQLEGNMTIKDEDVLKSYTEIVMNIVGSLSTNYITFLTTKYFRDEKALYEFISESVYTDLVKNATEINKKKLTKIKHKQVSADILELNNKKK